MRVTRIRRLWPYGARDLLIQIAIWVAFGLAYEAVRGIAGDDRPAAFANGRAIISVERQLHALFEATLQRAVGQVEPLSVALRATYWLSEFALLVAGLTWVYFRNRSLYARFRDSVLVANVLGLVGYLVVPTAPPRLFGGVGFVNRLSGQPRPNHPGGLIGFAANPYAAMPSIHAADAVLIGVFLAAATAGIVRALWLAWPFWVFFAVLATGNHFWLDVAAGVVAACAGLAVAEAHRRLRAGSGAIRAPFSLPTPRPSPRARRTQPPASSARPHGRAPASGERR
jgi:hypothetical protein